MNKQTRYDRTFIQDYTETDDGFLTVRAVVTRPGVFPYQRSDGTVQYELKHPEDIFSNETIRSVNAKSVTDDHPPEPVTTKNVSRYGKGLSHGNASVEDNGIAVTFTIYDEELIRKIIEGEKEEISLGFEAEIVAEEGTYEGQSYQFRQTNVNVNHIAVVEQGRVGPEAAIRGDSDAWQIDSNNNGGGNMPKVRIDNKDYEVDSAVKSRLDALQTKADSYDQVKSEYDTLKAHSDAKDTQIQNLTKERDEAKNNAPTQDALDQAVKERMQLVDTARDFLEDNFEFEKKSDQDIKVAVIQSQDGQFKADEQSDEYINARYDATVSLLQNTSQSATGNNQMKFTANHNDAVQKKRQQRLNMRDSK